jgi:hypothetical protein
MSRIASSRLALRLLPRTTPAASLSSLSPAVAASAAAAAASFPSKEAAAAALPSKEAAAAASSSTTGDPSSAPPKGAGKPFGLLKAGILTAVTAALGATGYVTYGAISDLTVPLLSVAVLLALR